MKKIYAFGLLLMTILLLNNLVSADTISSTASTDKFVDFTVDPADGSTVKSLSIIKVTLPCIDETFESMLDYNEDVVSQIKVIKGDETVAEFNDFGDVMVDDATNIMTIPIILSTTITEAGTYTIDIPEKAFVEKSWNPTENAMVAVTDGWATPAYSGTVTVDTNAVSICNDYTLSPASGETVDQISTVTLTFNRISGQEYFSGWDFPNATFTNGEETIEAIINYDMTSGNENRVMTITPIDESEEPSPITAAGTWTMTIPAGIFSYSGESNGVITAEYTISAPKYADMLVDPADGATVKSLSVIRVTLPCIDDTFESMLEYNEDILSQLSVKNGDEVVATFGEIGDPTADDEGNTIVPINLSAPITEAGSYTIDIPEKAFVEKRWSDADDAMVAVKGGFVTPAYSGTVTVDPNAVSICDDYTLSPASGEIVDQISVVKVTFNKISGEEYFDGWEFPNATFSNGEKTIEAIVNYDWMSESENRVMTVTPIDESEEFTPITDAGSWTMTINPGTFNYNGESNSVITAEYTIKSESSPYNITPESGTVVDNLTSITIEFNGATQIEYNELPITLVGPEYNISSTDVLGTGNIRTVSFRNPSVDGEYTVTFPAGAFTIDGEESEVITALYTFRKSYVLTPESGSTLKSFEVALSFPNATDVEYNQDSASITLTNYSSYAAPSINCVKDATASVPTFILTIPDHAQKPAYGNYELLIEEGSFIIDGKACSEIVAKYFINPDITVDYQITPDGTIVYQDYGYDFAIMFDESSSVRIADKSKIRITLDGIEIPATSYESSTEMNMLLFFVYDPQFCKDGILKLNLEEGALSLGGNTMSPAIEAQWTLTAPKTYSVNITPAENTDKTPVKELETIYVNFPEATSGDIYNEYGAYLRKTDYSYTEAGTITKVESIPGIETTGVNFAIKFPKADSQGTYNLSVREGTFDLDGVYASPEIEVTYFVAATSGISDMFADENGNITVYSVDGKLVLNNAPAVELNNVAKGIYIINGKKVVLK